MRKYLLDGNIYDEILGNPEVRTKLNGLCAIGTVSLIGTWIESSEIAAMSPSKPEKWLAISELLSQLSIDRVPVAGIILDHSKIGETRLIEWDESALLSASLKSSGSNQRRPVPFARLLRFTGLSAMSIPFTMLSHNMRESASPKKITFTWLTINQ